MLLLLIMFTLAAFLNKESESSMTFRCQEQKLHVALSLGNESSTEQKFN